MEEKTIVTKSAKETEKLGEEIGKQLSGRSLICLYGDLGSGKTTFVKGISQSLGIDSRIISPTFVLLRTHSVKKENRSNIYSPEILYHLDLYRLNKAEEAREIGLQELVDDIKAVTLIEWPEKVKHILPERRWEIYFEWINDNERKIQIHKRI